jgi:transcriptional regulator with XRE-family HTH domain
LQIYSIVKERGLTQVEAAKVLGIRQPQVSLLMRNRAGSFSIGRLMELLTALGQDVEIAVRPTHKEHGQMYVVPSSVHSISEQAFLIQRRRPLSCRFTDHVDETVMTLSRITPATSTARMWSFLRA